MKEVHLLCITNTKFLRELKADFPLFAEFPVVFQHIDISYKLISVKLLLEENPGWASVSAQIWCEWNTSHLTQSRVKQDRPSDTSFIQCDLSCERGRKMMCLFLSHKLFLVCFFTFLLHLFFSLCFSHRCFFGGNFCISKSLQTWKTDSDQVWWPMRMLREAWCVGFASNWPFWVPASAVASMVLRGMLASSALELKSTE